PRIEELANATARDHADGPGPKLFGDILEAVLSKPPVEIPVHVHPGRPAPGGVRFPGRVEARLGRRDGRDRVRQPELLLVQQVPLDERPHDLAIEIRQDDREEDREGQDFLRRFAPESSEMPIARSYLGLASSPVSSGWITQTRPSSSGSRTAFSHRKIRSVGSSVSRRKATSVVAS